jgi:hypothetical protein
MPDEIPFYVDPVALALGDLADHVARLRGMLATGPQLVPQLVPPVLTTKGRSGDLCPDLPFLVELRRIELLTSSMP